MHEAHYDSFGNANNAALITQPSAVVAVVGCGPVGLMAVNIRVFVPLSKS